MVEKIAVHTTGKIAVFGDTEWQDCYFRYNDIAVTETLKLQEWGKGRSTQKTGVKSLNRKNTSEKLLRLKGLD